MDDKEIFQEVTNHLIGKFPMFSTYLMSSLLAFNEIAEGQERHKKRIFQRWEDSKSLPRKLKKKSRKRLMLEWSIANWNPLEI